MPMKQVNVKENNTGERMKMKTKENTIKCYKRNCEKEADLNNDIIGTYMVGIIIGLCIAIALFNTIPLLI